MNRKIKRDFTRVKNLETEKYGSIADRLSVQFTVNYDDGSFGFLMNKDRGVVWEYKHDTD